MDFQRGIRPLTMAEQEFVMLLHRPAFTRKRRNPWVWRGIVQARPHGQSYVVDIEAGYRSGGGVKIWCLEPTLVPTKETGRPPHTFPDGSLCVNDVNPTEYEFIALTTVPWIHSWLYFYERWVETGTWFGPQAPGHELGSAGRSESRNQKPVRTNTPKSRSTPKLNREQAT